MATQQLIILNSNSQFAQYTPVIASSGTASAGQTVALNAAGQIDTTMLPPSNGMPSLSLTASGAIGAGDLVSISSSGEVVVANATGATSPAVGFAPSAIATGATGTISFTGSLNSGASGLTVGAPVFLGTTAGPGTSTPPTAVGNIVQQVGFAISATEYVFVPGPIVQL